MSVLVDKAACKKSNAETFFPPGRRDNQRRREVVLAAQAICAKCSVQQACARLAVSRPVATNGVFAGVDLGDGGHGDEYAAALAQLKQIAGAQ